MLAKARALDPCDFPVRMHCACILNQGALDGASQCKAEADCVASQMVITLHTLLADSKALSCEQEVILNHAGAGSRRSFCELGCRSPHRCDRAACASLPVS